MLNRTELLVIRRYSAYLKHTNSYGAKHPAQLSTSMLECSKNVESLEELRHYVADTLSDLEMLKSDQFQLSQRILHRGGTPCGIYFCLQGPRALRLSAI